MSRNLILLLTLVAVCRAAPLGIDAQPVERPSVTLRVEYPEILKEVIPDGLESIVLMQGKRQDSLNMVGTAHITSPSDGCDNYHDVSPSQAGNIYFVGESGNCAMATKIHFAQKANAKALILIHSDDTLTEIKQEEEFPGVHIPVLMIRRSDGHKINEMLYEIRHSVVQIGLTFNQKRHETILLDLWFSPDSYTALNFLSKLTKRDHGADLNTKLILKPHFVLWHCDDCADKNFMYPRPGCFSGGRYCALSGTGGDPKKAELILEETLNAICFNKVLQDDPAYNKDSGLQNKIMHIWLKDYRDNCVEASDSACIFNFLETKDKFLQTNAEAMGIEKDIHAKLTQCWKDSWEKGPDATTQINPMLHDNKLLRAELAEFKKVSAYEHFPLLKINGMNYSGKISMWDVKMHICNDILTDKQCHFKPGGMFRIMHGYWGLWYIVFAILGLFLGSMLICRRRLKERYETELNLKIDQSIAGFLDK
jgi:hypothetical protein